MLNKKTFILICTTVFIISFIPLFMDWVIIGNNIPSNITNSDWVSFLGGYIGALIGAGVSLVGIIITIRYTNEQNKLDRELQVRPYCSIRYVHDDKIVGTNKVLAEIPIGCEPRENNGNVYTSILYIKNVGIGPAIEFEISIDAFDDGREHYPILMQRNAEISNRLVNLLQSGEEAAIPIHIHFNFDPITENDFVDTGEEGFFRFIVKNEVMQKYKNFEMIISIKYRDMHQNQYSQKITLASSIGVTRKSEGKQAEHYCDVYLKEFTTPEKMKK